MTNKKQALVTGGNKGIGLAIAKGLAETGMAVWLGSRDRGRGEEAVAGLNAQGLDVRLLEIDVADDANVKRAIAELSSEVDALHVLINNAGIIIDTASPPSEVRMEDIKATFEVNFLAPSG